MSRFTAVAVKSASLLAGFGLISAAAAADLKADLAPCLANQTAIGNVGSCGKIWKLKSGNASLSRDGKLKVTVRGLVLNDVTVGEYNGTPDGVDAVAAAVICHGPGGVTVAAQTEPVPLSHKGDAKVEANISLPNGCVGPVIVLRERYEGKIGGWLAGTGL